MVNKKRVKHSLSDKFPSSKVSKITKDEVISKSNVELELEDLLFGNGNFNKVESDKGEEAEDKAEEGGDSDEDFVEDKGPEASDNENDEDEDDEDLFFVDEEAGGVTEKDATEDQEEDDDEEEEDSDSDSDSSEPETRKLPQSAWQDFDDEEDESEEEIDITQTNRLKKLRKDADETSLNAGEYELRLRDQFEKLNPKPLWAQGKVLQEDGEEVFRDGHSLLEDGNSTGILEEGTIDIQKLSDVTINSPSKGRITFTKFHPELNSHILVGSSDHTLKLFQIDGKQNPHINTLKFKDISPEFGTFYNSGKGILTTGFRKHYYTIDVETNKATKHNRLWGHEGSIGYFELSPNEKNVAMTESNGVINIVNTDNMMKMGNFKTNTGGCVSMKWSQDSNYLYSLTVNGTIYKWDLRTYRCIQMFNDEGGYKSSYLGLSQNDEFMSIGSQSGFVNLYDATSLQGQKPTPKPIRSYDNLTSTITSVAFNMDSKLMCIGSSTSKNQVRLIHLPSRKVYSNWPNPNQGGVVYKPTSIEFSPNSAYLTIGNNMGKVNLFRLNYYKSV